MTDKQLEIHVPHVRPSDLCFSSNSPDTVVLAAEILRRQESPVTTVAE